LRKSTRDKVTENHTVQFWELYRSHQTSSSNQQTQPMCGIAGKLNFDTQNKIAFPEIKKMTDVISHRGPDDEGFYISQNVGLGFRRLSIIDLTTGHQPLSNEDETIWIVFNGEIYNYQELRENLTKQGHVFKTNSDTETIVHLYEQHGTGCVQYLRGMFAFCIWDDKKKQLFCARDRFGIKPFYYYSDNEKFLFASEIKAILQDSTVDKDLSYDALNSYFAFGYITSDLSIYKKIKKLRPAHYLLLSFNREVTIETHRYWNIQFDPNYSISEEQWAEELEQTFSEVVKQHMISDVPLGAFLSGGIDSTSVVAMMAKNSTRPIKTFSIGFREEKYNELVYARQTAKKYGCEHHEFTVEPDSVNLLPKLVCIYDEPFADISAIPTYYVSKFAREYVTVALSGDGGDELFAGYNIYSYLKRIRKYNFSSPAINTFIWGSIHKMVPEHVSGKGLMYFLSKNPNDLGAHVCIWTKNERKKLIIQDGQQEVINASELFKRDILRESKKDFISNLQYLDLRTYMVDDILTKVDRASMINSLEVRVPFLDHKFAELSFKIPSQLKMKDQTKKYIFKHAMKPFLSANILNNAKKGFDVPLSAWFRGSLKEFVNDTLITNNPLLAGYLNKDYVRNVINDNTAGMRDFSRKIWSLLFFEEWLKQNQ